MGNSTSNKKEKSFKLTLEEELVEEFALNENDFQKNDELISTKLLSVNQLSQVNAPIYRLQVISSDEIILQTNLNLEIININMGKTIGSLSLQSNGSKVLHHFCWIDHLNRILLCKYESYKFTKKCHFYLFRKSGKKV